MYLRRILSAGSGTALLSPVKEAAGIVGREAVQRELLVSLYTKILKEVEPFVEKERYCKKIDSFTRYRLRVLEEEEDLKQFVRRLRIPGGYGYTVELINEAKRQLEFITMLNECHPWVVPKDNEM